MSQVYVPETTVAGFSFMSDFGFYYVEAADVSDAHGAMWDLLKPKDGDRFPVTVVWDGKSYDTNMLYVNQADIGTAYWYIGNCSLWPQMQGAENTGETFLIVSVWGGFAVISTQEGSSHTFSVIEKSEDAGGGKINWAKLMQIYHLEGFEMAWLAYERMKGGQQSEVIATLTDGVLQIKKAPATLNGNTLEVK